MKVPPHDIELEGAVLGALMIDGGIDEIDLRPHHFYKDDYSNIFSVIEELYTEGKKIDILTVTKKLRDKKQFHDGFTPYEITLLTNRIASNANMEYHARLIQQMYIQRETIRIGSNMVACSFESKNDIFDVQQQAISEIDNLTNFKSVIPDAGLSELAKETDGRNDALLKNKGLSGVTCGLYDLDVLTGGWQKTDLIILAARPGMGKTSKAIKNAVSAAKSGKSVAFFSQEMSRIQLYHRIASAETNIDLVKFRRTGLNPLEQQIFKEWQEKSNKWILTIDDTAALPVQDMRTKCRQIKRKHGLDLVITDYIQLHSFRNLDSRVNRNDEISKISAYLKRIAKEIDVPIIALSQLSRQVEQRGGDKRPMLSDLRDSGAIEQDADIVMFLYRPEYYGFMEDANGNSTAGIALVDVAKHRNGKLDTVSVGWNGRYTQFSDLERNGNF